MNGQHFADMAFGIDVLAQARSAIVRALSVAAGEKRQQATRPNSNSELRRADHALPLRHAN